MYDKRVIRDTSGLVPPMQKGPLARDRSCEKRRVFAFEGGLPGRGVGKNAPRLYSIAGRKEQPA